MIRRAIVLAIVVSFFSFAIVGCGGSGGGDSDGPKIKGGATTKIPQKTPSAGGGGGKASD